MIEHFNFPVLANRNIGALYLTMGLKSFANGMIGVFVPMYLWNLGFTFAEILFFYFLFSAYVVLCGFLLMPVYSFLSDKMLIFLSIPFTILFYLGLDYIGDYQILVYLLPVSLALSTLFFNLGYNLDFSTSFDDGKVGKESGISVLVQSIAPMTAPLLGGFFITIFGFENSFYVASFILFTAIIPLFVVPGKKMSNHLKSKDIYKYLKNTEIKKFNLSEIALAVDPRTETVIWALLMFLIIGNFEDIGLVLSGGLLAGAIISYVAGAFSDKGYRKGVLQISTWGVALMWFIRPFIIAIPVVVGSHVLRKIFRSSMLSAWSSEFYEIARNVKHVSLFLLTKEIFTHFIRASFTGFLIVLTFLYNDLGVMTIAFLLSGILVFFALFANQQKESEKIRA